MSQQDPVLRNIIGAWNAKQTNRYQAPVGEDCKYHDQLLRAEESFANYIGTRFALGVNSGGSAIKLILEYLKNRADSDLVYTNCFTFNAVPSAIVDAGLTPVLVECTRGLVVDIDDLRAKFQSLNGKIFLLSYMRGFVPDIDAIKALCEEFSIVLVEDAAHAYGIEYKGKRIGSFGFASAMSTQSNKLINTGEGGFICTDDEDLMARSIIRAGSYEAYWQRHGKMTPSREHIMRYIYTTPNTSCRLSNIQGAMALAQFSDINERIENLNKNHAFLAKELQDVAEVITQADFVTTPVYDSIQVRVDGLTNEKAKELANNIKKHFKFQLFATETNARFFRTWKFMKDEVDHSQTIESLNGVFDMRISHSCTENEMTKIAETIKNEILSIKNVRVIGFINA